MIYKGSRYEYSTIDYFTASPNGANTPIVFYEMIGASTLTYRLHTYIQGERLDQLAVKYFKSAISWWLIPEFNPEIIDFNNIEPGTVLRIPNV